MGVRRFEKSSFLNGMKMPWYSASSFIFCPEPTIIEDIWMRTIPVTIMAIISNVLLWQLLVITYVKSYFLTITRHIHNGFWKTPCSWRFYGHGRTYVIILFWVNIMTQKWAKLPWKLSVAQNPSLFFKENCTKTFHLFLNSSFSLRQTWFLNSTST